MVRVSIYPSLANAVNGAVSLGVVPRGANKATDVWLFKRNFCKVNSVELPGVFIWLGGDIGYVLGFSTNDDVSN